MDTPRSGARRDPLSGVGGRDGGGGQPAHGLPSPEERRPRRWSLLLQPTSLRSQDLPRSATQTRVRSDRPSMVLRKRGRHSLHAEREGLPSGCVPRSRDGGEALYLEPTEGLEIVSSVLALGMSKPRSLRVILAVSLVALMSCERPRKPTSRSARPPSQSSRAGDHVEQDEGPERGVKPRFVSCKEVEPGMPCTPDVEGLPPAPP